MPRLRWSSHSSSRSPGRSSARVVAIRTRCPLERRRRIASSTAAWLPAPAQPVVAGRGGRVERELERETGARERVEAVEHARREERAVRERERRQDLRQRGERRGERPEHEDLTAGDPERGEAVVAGGRRCGHQPRIPELTSVGDPWARLGQAVGAREVAVVGGVQPETVPCASLGDHPVEPVAQRRDRSRCHGSSVARRRRSAPARVRARLHSAHDQEPARPPVGRPDARRPASGKRSARCCARSGPRGPRARPGSDPGR